MPRLRNKKRADGRLQAKVYLGVIDGKAKYKYVYAGTQKELEAKVRDVKIALGKGLDVTANSAESVGSISSRSRSSGTLPKPLWTEHSNMQTRR